MTVNEKTDVVPVEERTMTEDEKNNVMFSTFFEEVNLESLIGKDQGTLVKVQILFAVEAIREFRKMTNDIIKSNTELAKSSDEHAEKIVRFTKILAILTIFIAVGAIAQTIFMIWQGIAGILN